MEFEADMYGHLRYDRADIQALQADDQDGCVVYVATFSTMLYPGIRIAFAVVPHSALPEYRRVLEATDRSPAAVEQIALARFIKDGHLGRHVVRLREAYSERQATLLACIERHLGGRIEACESPAGTTLVGRLVDSRLSVSRLAEVASRLGVELDPMSAFSPTKRYDHEIVLAYAHLTPIENEAGIRRLAMAVKQSLAA